MLVPKNVFALDAVVSRDLIRTNLCGVHLKRDEDGIAHAVATNGKMLVEARWNEFEPDEFPRVSDVKTERVANFATTIKSESWNAVGKALPKKSKLPILECAAIEEPDCNGTVRLAATDLRNTAVVEGKTTEERFPDFCQVMPQYRMLTHGGCNLFDSEGEAVSLKGHAVQIVVNAKLLADMLTTLWKLAGAPADSKDAASVVLTVPVDPHKPLLAHSTTYSALRSDHGVKARAALMPIYPGEDDLGFPHPLDDHRKAEMQRKHDEVMALAEAKRKSEEAEKAALAAQVEPTSEPSAAEPLAV